MFLTSPSSCEIKSREQSANSTRWCGHMEAQIDRDAIAAMESASLPDAWPAERFPSAPSRRPGRRQQPAGPLRHLRRVAVRRWLGHADAGCRRPAAARHHPDPRLDPRSDQLEHLPGHRLRPGGQSVPRLRARLHLLLRAPDARLSRLLAGPGFRDQADLQARGGGASGEGAAQARLRRPRPWRSGPTPIPTSRWNAR